MELQIPLFNEVELPVPADTEEEQIVQKIAQEAGYGEDADIDPDTGMMFN